MINRTSYILSLVAPIALMACVTHGSDTITIKTNSYTCVFEKFKNNRFYFQAKDGKPMNSMKTLVSSLVMDPPANVSVKPFGKKKIEKIKFKGYENSKFIFLENNKEIIIPKVSLIEMELDFSRSMALKKEENNTEEPGKEVDLATAVKPGAVTVVHFHLPELMPSVRQGNYIEKQAADSKGKIRFVRISFSDWQDPGLKKYGIETLPQFWIYDKKAKLSRKLIDRFTAEDLDAAVKDAGK